MPQRMISEDYFADPIISELDSHGKLLFLYLICNQHNKMCGFYKITERMMALETATPLRKVKQLLQHFQDEGKIVYENGFIFIKNMARHQNCAKLLNGRKHVENTIKSNTSQLYNSAYQAFLKEMDKLGLLNEKERIYLLSPQEGLGKPLEGTTKQETINNNPLTINNEQKGESEGERSPSPENEPQQEASKPEMLHDIQKFIQTKCPQVHSALKQITFEECEQLRAAYPNGLEPVFRVLGQMENCKNIGRKYVSTYLTLRNWLDNYEYRNKQQVSNKTKTSEFKFQKGNKNRYGVH